MTWHDRSKPFSGQDCAGALNLRLELTKGELHEFSNAITRRTRCDGTCINSSACWLRSNRGERCRVMAPPTPCGRLREQTQTQPIRTGTCLSALGIRWNATQIWTARSCVITREWAHLYPSSPVSLMAKRQFRSPTFLNSRSIR